MYAASVNEIESKILTKGLFKKTGMWCVIIVAHSLDMVIFGGADVARLTVVLILWANESISILENAGKLGVEVPDELMSYFAQLKDKTNDNLKDKLDNSKDENKK